MGESTKTALAVAAVIAVAAAFWLLLLAPKRDKAGELSHRADALSAEVSSEQAKASEALAAKKEYPRDYERLVLIGTAVPAEADTPSLLVQLDGVGVASHTAFTSIELAAGGESSSEATEGSAGLLPLGAAEGPAGFSKMPYTVEFEGGFFQIANFIHRLDSLVKTKNGEVDAKGRLITIDGFNLAPEESLGSSGLLKASFSISTYVTPPGQGLTAGASPSGLAEAPEATPSLP